MPIAVGSVLAERFEIVRPLQVGGMGSVFEGRDRAHGGLRCAIKKMLEHLSEGEMAQVYRQRFHAETNFLKQLCHPGIPRLLDSFEIDGAYYIAMEFVPGRNLAQELEERLKLTGYPMPVDQLVRDMRHVLEIVVYLHDLNPPLVHRDIKPANLIREHPSGRIKLVDFGLARSLSLENKTQTQIGTLGYSPLEQLQGRSEARSDIYALGVTMHELVTGCPPTPLEIPPVLKLRPDLDPSLAALIDKAAAAKPDDRFRNAKEMLKELNKLGPLTPKVLPLEIAPRPASTTPVTRQYGRALPTQLIIEESDTLQVDHEALAEVRQYSATPSELDIETLKVDEMPTPPRVPKPEPKKLSVPSWALAVAAVLGAFLLGRAMTGSNTPAPVPAPTTATAPVAVSTAAAETPLPAELPLDSQGLTPTPVAAAPIRAVPIATPTPVNSFEKPFSRKTPRPAPRPHVPGAAVYEPPVAYKLDAPKYPTKVVKPGSTAARPRRTPARPVFDYTPAATSPEPVVSLPDEWTEGGRTAASLEFTRNQPRMSMVIKSQATREPHWRIRNSFLARRAGWAERGDLAGVDLALEKQRPGRYELEALVLRRGHYYVMRVESRDRGSPDHIRSVADSALASVDIPGNR